VVTRAKFPEIIFKPDDPIFRQIPFIKAGLIEKVKSSGADICAEKSGSRRSSFMIDQNQI